MPDSDEGIGDLLEMTLMQGQDMSRTSPFIVVVVFRMSSDFRWS